MSRTTRNPLMRFPGVAPAAGLAFAFLYLPIVVLIFYWGFVGYMDNEGNLCGQIGLLHQVVTIVLWCTAYYSIIKRIRCVGS